MILSCGERTDIVQYYTPWLLNRLEEGYADVRNPFYPKRVNRYPLNPDVVDTILFCSKNYRPILPYMHDIMRQYPVYCHYTITAYVKDIEPNVPSIKESIETLKELSSIVGRNRITWRYDPVLIYGKYDVNLHMRYFARMAELIALYAHRCVFSFVLMYKKLAVTFPDLKPVSEADQEVLLEHFGRVANQYGIAIQTCGDARNLSRYGIARSGCTTMELLNQANDLNLVNVPLHNQRPGTGCRCIDQRAIGAYDTCMNGCRYCYATSSMDRVKENIRKHDPKSSILIGHLKPDDELVISNPKSFRAEVKQISLF